MFCWCALLTLVCFCVLCFDGVEWFFVILRCAIFVMVAVLCVVCVVDGLQLEMQEKKNQLNLPVFKKQCKRFWEKTTVETLSEKTIELTIEHGV